MAVRLGAEPLSLDTLVGVAREGTRVELDRDAVDRIVAARRVVEDHLSSGTATYGLNTGLGALADVRIDRGAIEQMQHNVVRSHAAGVGDPLPAEVVRAMMLSRANVFCAGRSGVRPVVVERLVDYLNAELHPAVPSRGSVGASGDLAQLAHVALTLIGEGRFLAGEGSGRSAPEDATRRAGAGRSPAARGARTVPAGEVLRRRGITPLRLAAKEGLALINGTDGMLALGVLAVHDVARLLRVADVAAALTVEGALGTDRPFAADLQDLRPHPGQSRAAANLRRLLAGSAITASHRDSTHAVQDPYSLRCAPQVHGACRDAHRFCREVLERELGSVVDNPVVLPDGRIESTGNFHGEPLAYALDFLGVALCGLANISERRTHLLLSAGPARDLPPFLAADPGLESGYMVAQYTQASLLAECKLLADPAGTDSIPTSGSQEDHVSMGWLAGLKLRRLVGLATTVLAIELLCAARAGDLREPLRPAAGTGAARRRIRDEVRPLVRDREVSPDIGAVEGLIADGGLLRAVQEAVGSLA